MGKGGVPLEVAGNELCWVNQWKYLRKATGSKSQKRLLWRWNDRYAKWGEVPWGDRYVVRDNKLTETT